jgi:hypothetical protein
MKMIEVIFVWRLDDIMLIGFLSLIAIGFVVYLIAMGIDNVKSWIRKRLNK